jgi:hypothetical protein
MASGFSKLWVSRSFLVDGPATQEMWENSDRVLVNSVAARAQVDAAYILLVGRKLSATKETVLCLWNLV